MITIIYFYLCLVVLTDTYYYYIIIVPLRLLRLLFFLGHPPFPFTFQASPKDLPSNAHIS